MTEDFKLYFGIGWDHILSKDALDHILFLVVLSAVYSFRTWKKALIVVTAFTIGHSLTLFLSILDYIRFVPAYVEFFIPVTIALTGLANLFLIRKTAISLWYSFIAALVFGLIHGMGFANNIRFMLAENDSVGWPLFSFNAGIEVAQIILVSLILFIHFIIVEKAGFPRKWWTIILSLTGLIPAVLMAWERWPF